MLGLCSSDYNQAGGWSTRYGYRWGAEDVDFFSRVTQAMPLIIRSTEPDYLHVRGREQNNDYYETKNLYHEKLPPSSLSITVLNVEVHNKLLHFIQHNIDHLSDLNLKVNHVSRTYGEDAKKLVYHIHLIDKDPPYGEYIVMVLSHLSPVV